MTRSQLQELKQLKDKIAILSLGLSPEISEAALRIGTILMEVEFETPTEPEPLFISPYTL